MLENKLSFYSLCVFSVLFASQVGFAQPKSVTDQDETVSLASGCAGECGVEADDEYFEIPLVDEGYYEGFHLPLLLPGPRGMEYSFAYPLSHIVYLSKQQSFLALPQFVLQESADPRTVPARDPRFLWTAVIDLDETLVHVSSTSGLTLVRPFARDLLSELALNPEIEIIVWTGGIRNLAVNSLNALSGGNPGLRVNHLVYRGPAWMDHGTPTRKDLSLLRRFNAILVENTHTVAESCNGSAVVVPNFTGDFDDAVMFDVRKLFQTIKISADRVMSPRDCFPIFSIFGDLITFKCLGREEGVRQLPVDFLRSTLLGPEVSALNSKIRVLP